MQHHFLLAKEAMQEHATTYPAPPPTFSVYLLLNCYCLHSLVIFSLELKFKTFQDLLAEA